MVRARPPDIRQPDTQVIVRGAGTCRDALSDRLAASFTELRVMQLNRPKAAKVTPLDRRA